MRLLLGIAIAVAGLAFLGGGVALIANWQIYVANLRARQGLPNLEVPGAGGRILIVAPHPDDEVLGCGGLIRQAVRGGAQVYVILMTNGDASELALLYERTFRRTPSEYLALGRQRLKESLAGLAQSGVPADHVYSLGYPNGGLEALYGPAYWSRTTPWFSPRTRVAHNPYTTSFDRGAVYCGQNVVDDLTTLIHQIDPDMIFCAAPFDIHPDHWATWGFMRLAVEQAGWQSEGEPRPLYAYLVHRPDWPAPHGYLPKNSLDPPAALAQTAYLDWYQLPLSRDEVRLKTRALGAYRSQAPHYDWTLYSLLRTNELFALIQPRPTRTRMVVIQDPVGDLPRVRLRPEGDVSTVALAPEPTTWRVDLTVAGNVDPDLTYCLLGHGVEGNVARAWLLTLHAGAGEVIWSDGKALQRTPAPWRVSGQTLESRVPAELLAGRGVFVEAYTSFGPRLVDHTVTAAVPRGAPPVAAPGALTGAAGALSGPS